MFTTNIKEREREKERRLGILKRYFEYNYTVYLISFEDVKKIKKKKIW